MIITKPLSHGRVGIYCDQFLIAIVPANSPVLVGLTGEKK